MRKDRYPSPHSVWRRGDSTNIIEHWYKVAPYAAPRPPRERGRPDAGFTLLELLVAITLLGLIVTLLFGGLRFGTRAWEAADERIDQSSELQVVQSFMRRRLGQAYPLDVSQPAAERRIAFAGTPEGVTFATMLPAHLGLGGFYWLSFYSDEGSDGKRLVASWRLFQPGTDEVADAGAAGITVLAERISGVEFSYFGPSDPGRPAEWQDRWEGVGSLPALVRIGVSFAESDRRSWPDLVVAPMLDQNR